MNFERVKLPWVQEVWGRLDQPVDAEVDRTSIAGKALPLYDPLPAETTVVPSVIFDPAAGTVNESQTTPFIEFSSEFFLSPQQLEKEADLGIAVTAAVSRANQLALAEDCLVFQGTHATSPSTLIVPADRVRWTRSN